MKLAPKTTEGEVAGRQEVTSGTSPSTNRKRTRSWRFGDLSWRRAYQLTGFQVSPAQVCMVTGDHLRRQFHASRWVVAARSPGQPVEESLQKLVTKGYAPRGRVCIAIPESHLTIRYFDLPSHDEEEIDAMVEHQLRLAVPVPIEHLAWTSTVVDEKPRGEARVMTHIIRKDHLKEVLRPYREAGIEVHRVVPEAFVLADACEQALGTRMSGVGSGGGTEALSSSEVTATSFVGTSPTKGSQEQERSAILLVQGHVHVLVHRGTMPVFLRSFSVPVVDVQQLNARSSSELFLASASPMETARREYERSFDKPWPEPMLLFPDTQGNDVDREVLDKLALRFAERLQLKVTCVEMPQQEVPEGVERTPEKVGAADMTEKADEAGKMHEAEIMNQTEILDQAEIVAQAEETAQRAPKPPDTLLSLLRVASTSKVNLLPREYTRRGIWREKVGTFVAGAVTLVVVLTVGALWAVGDLNRMEKRLGVLESTLAQDRESWRDLAAMRRELSQATMRDARALAALQALYSTFKSGVSGLHLVQFTYDKNQGISLKGHAPQVATITNFAEKLAQGEGWRDVKVLSIHQTSRTNDRSFQFEIQAQWTYEGRSTEAGP